MAITSTADFGFPGQPKAPEDFEALDNDALEALLKAEAKKPARRGAKVPKPKDDLMGTMYDFIENEKPLPFGVNDKNTEFLIGIEYEIEDLKAADETVVHSLGMTVTKDGSLRNNGREFITGVFGRDSQITRAKGLFDHLKLGPNAFSPRTSIHVHMNVAGMKYDNFLSLILTYAALEPFFFSFVGKERATNIHCVPLYDTYLSKYYKEQNVGALISKWSKYTALNIRPVVSQGSIEFRHMYGTNDIVKIETWLKIIEALFNFALKVDYKELYNFWLAGGTGKSLEKLVFGDLIYKCPVQLTEQDYLVSVMEAKSAYL